MSELSIREILKLNLKEFVKHVVGVKYNSRDDTFLGFYVEDIFVSTYEIRAYINNLLQIGGEDCKKALSNDIEHYINEEIECFANRVFLLYDIDIYDEDNEGIIKEIRYNTKEELINTLSNTLEEWHKIEEFKKTDELRFLLIQDIAEGCYKRIDVLRSVEIEMLRDEGAQVDTEGNNKIDKLKELRPYLTELEKQGYITRNDNKYTWGEKENKTELYYLLSRVYNEVARSPWREVAGIFTNIKATAISKEISRLNNTVNTDKFKNMDKIIQAVREK